MKRFIGSTFRAVVPSLFLLSTGFILCMHWFLLMADSLTEGVTAEIIPVNLIARIMTYYTIVFGPLTWLVKVFILLMLLTVTLQLFIREIPWYLKWPIFLIKVPLIFNGVLRIIPLVDQFILNTDTPEVQSQMVRTVHDAHVLSAWGTLLVIVLQLIVMVLLMRCGEIEHS